MAKISYIMYKNIILHNMIIQRCSVDYNLKVLLELDYGKQPLWRSLSFNA
jgi:hypothetical protein